MSSFSPWGGLGEPGEACVKCGGKEATLGAHAPTRGASPKRPSMAVKLSDFCVHWYMIYNIYLYIQGNISMFWTCMTMETSKILHFRNCTSNCSNSSRILECLRNFMTLELFTDPYSQKNELNNPGFALVLHHGSLFQYRGISKISKTSPCGPLASMPQQSVHASAFFLPFHRRAPPAQISTCSPRFRFFPTFP
jgi:hypothetical protein